MSSQDVEGVDVDVLTDDGTQFDRTFNASGTCFGRILRLALRDEKSM